MDKSRFVKEKSKIPISVSFEKGIQKWAGMFDVAVDLGYIIVPAKGWYQTPIAGWEKVRRSSIEYDSKFWTNMLADTDLAEAIEQKYSLSSQDVLNTEE